nr:hypothetical protein [Micromonospora sp. DSM 115978]
AGHLIAAATSACQTGALAAASALVRQASPGTLPSRLRGQAELLEGELEARRGQPRRGYQALVEAADRLADTSSGSQVRQALVAAAEASCLTGELSRYHALAPRFRELAERGTSRGADRLVADQYVGVVAALTGRHAE